jgi:excinuclease ABC subunit B
MLKAAADLEFETAARLRDEIKRLRETELAVADDPLARQADVEERAGSYGGERKYGKAPRMGSDPAGLTPGSSRASSHGVSPGLRRGAGSDPAEGSRIQREYQPVQPTYAQSTTIPSAGPGSRARKPALDEMGSAANRPIPARAPQVDPRTKAGAYGEQVRGPHKPTLDEMGPHAERGLPVAGKPLPVQPPAPAKGIDIPDQAETKKHRHGRPRKTGRPGQ